MTVSDWVETKRQQRVAKKLDKKYAKEYAADDDVEITYTPADQNAPHGVNLPGEMDVNSDTN